MRAPLTAILLVAAAPLGAAPDPLDALVAKVVRAYGGPKALDAARAFRQTGTLVSPTRGPGRLAREFVRPAFLHVEVAYAGGAGELRVLDGPRAFRDGREVSGPPRDAMALQAARLDLPALLSAWRERVKDAGTRALAGRPLRGLELPLGEGLTLVAWVDAASGRILRSEGRAVTGPVRVEFATDYSDFRSVGGALFAFVEDNFASGQSTGRTTLEEVVLTPPGSSSRSRGP